MSKTFIPHYSALPEERYIVEVSTMEKPDEWMDGYGNKVERYNSHLAQLKKYPMPAMPVEWKDGRVVVDGIDFIVKPYGLSGIVEGYIAVPVTSPSVVTEKFSAVEYAGFWNIQTVEGYEESDNILDAESVGAENAEKYAKLIVELLNKHYGIQ